MGASFSFSFSLSLSPWLFLSKPDLRERLYTVAQQYADTSRWMARDRLLQVLQHNDCHDIVVGAMNGDILARAFFHAAGKNHVDVLEAFLHHGMNVNIKNQFGQGRQRWTALMSAATTESEESFRLLLHRNADVDVQTDQGRTVLMMMAAKRTQISCTILEMLLDKEANVDLQDNDGHTALIEACHFGCVKNVTLLLEKRANPDFQGEPMGWTALMCASERGHTEIVQLLLLFNADIEIKSHMKKTALDLAKHQEISRLLQNHVPPTYVLK